MISGEFLCHWGEGYEPKADITVTFDWFTLDRGYLLEDRNAIEELSEGDTLDLP